MHSATEVPLRFAERTLADYRPQTKSQTEALEAARRVAAGEYRGLVLVGPPGVGKTHLAAGIVNAVTERLLADYRQRKAAAYAEADEFERLQQQVRHPRLPELPSWANVADLIVSMRLEFNAPADDREATLTAMRLSRHPALVVLDDLGRERVSDWTGEVVFSLVNARYEAKLPTVVTSNLSPKELAAGPYWAALSRLAEDGVLIHVEGKDHRLSATAGTA